MSDYEACADLCDDRGFERQAALLRDVGAGRGRVYIIETPFWIEEADWDDEAEESESEPGPTRTVYLDREAAERAALDLSARALRRFSSGSYSTPSALRYLTSLSRDEFCARVGAILDLEYQIPKMYEPLVPDTASDAQLRQIVPLLNVPRYTVTTVEIAP